MNEARPKVVVTGASGLLGRATMRLLSRDHCVTGIDLRPDAPEVLACDIRDTDRLAALFRGADSVLHLAGQDSAEGVPSERFFDLNSFGTWSVCEAAERAGVGRMVYCSSASVYGLDHTNPGLSPERLPVDEDHPTSPSQPYALSKRAAEEAMAALARRQPQMSVLTLRLSAVICADDITDLRRDLGETRASWKTESLDAPKTGRNDYWVPLFRSYIELTDAATAFAAALKANMPGYQVFNICADDTLIPEPTLGFVQRVLGALPRIHNPRRYQSNPRAAVFSNAKARRDLSWVPQQCWRDMTRAADWPPAEKSGDSNV
ncbi:MAG: NAD-dependent epimerase/dehydratase family protein [Albidovulum sp.]|uniref:NAD-dependent epimerase/dehydratase family protein n=1 Tax=Albidovulum sp. TaxID=1872424 RepID=UPI003CC2EF1F